MTRIPTRTPTFRAATIMGDALYKLAAWLSPAYPVGAFSFSHGLEQAVAGDTVCNASSAQEWIGDCLRFGAGRADAILLCHAWRAAGRGEGGGDEFGQGVQDDAAMAGVKSLVEITSLACALSPSAERLGETVEIGTGFAAVTAQAWGAHAPAAPYPVAVGVAAARAGIALAPCVQLFLQAYVANLVSAAVRLVPLGQTEGQAITATLMDDVAAVAADAIAARLEDIGGCAILSDIASMRHETQEVRLFRS